MPRIQTITCGNIACDIFHPVAGSDRPLIGLEAFVVSLAADRDALKLIVTKASELLDLIYPIEAFDGSSGDRGAVLVAELRGMIGASKAKGDTVVEEKTEEI